MSEETTGLTTYEEAKLCPKCGRSGDVRRITPAPNMPYGTKVHQIYCVTEVCRWFNTPWMVQVNADGSIPPATDHLHDKPIIKPQSQQERVIEAQVKELTIAEELKQGIRRDRD